MKGLSAAGSRNLVQLLKSKGVVNSQVLDVMSKTPRDSFVDEALASKSYENTVLPIGFGQFIPPPCVTGRVLEFLFQQPMTSVLEVGTGSGYQTALLAKLVERVATIERVKSLQIGARKRLKKMDLHNVSFKNSDGYEGWHSKGPFSGIIVNGSVPEVPEVLLEQLTVHGVLLIPIGDVDPILTYIIRRQHRFEYQNLDSIRCAPLVSGIDVS